MAVSSQSVRTHIYHLRGSPGGAGVGLRAMGNTRLQRRAVNQRGGLTPAHPGTDPDSERLPDLDPAQRRAGGSGPPLGNSWPSPWAATVRALSPHLPTTLTYPKEFTTSEPRQRQDA